MNSQATSRSSPTFLPWVITISVSAIAIIAWGNYYHWQLDTVTSYQIFPLLGLLGFSIMWSHYVAGLLQNFIFKAANLQMYFRFTSYAVLLAIVLHPGILIYQRFHDGYGLPPGSYESYVAPSVAWVTLLGSISLLVFLAYELHRFYGKKSWWKYVLYAGDGAMIAIFYHALRLGDQLMHGWFRGVWWFYGISLVAILVYTYGSKLQLRKQQPNKDRHQ